MNDSLYDRLLLILAWVAPLSLLLLSRWQVSLETWYAPMDGDYLSNFSRNFAASTADWLRNSDAVGAKLYLIVDRECPCTNVTIKKVRAASDNEHVPLSVIDSHDSGVAWPIPATPTLIAVDGKRLVYVGPAISGNICSSTSNRVLGLSALQARAGQPIFNLLDRGCYCATR